MGRTRGPCDCKWCHREAIPRAGAVQLCEVCQRGVNRVARRAAMIQDEEGSSNHAIGKSLGMGGDSWSRLRRLMRDKPDDDLVTARIDPMHPMYTESAPAPAAKDAGSGWQHRAACRGHKDPDAFFPEDKMGREIAKVLAREFCDRCPVVVDCHKSRRRHGVWGGRFYDGSLVKARKS